VIGSDFQTRKVRHCGRQCHQIQPGLHLLQYTGWEMRSSGLPCPERRSAYLLL
jgi:hypothetical protein